MSASRRPTPADTQRFLELVRTGTDPAVAARELGYAGSSRFRSLGRRDPEFGRAYVEAKVARLEILSRRAETERKRKKLARPEAMKVESA